MRFGRLAARPTARAATTPNSGPTTIPPTTRMEESVTTATVTTATEAMVVANVRNA